MEVHIVEEAKKVEKREVPFVVGGVYRFNDGGEYRMLVCVEQRHFMIDIEEGVPRWHDITPDEVSEGYEYVPNAYLAIPKESK